MAEVIHYPVPPDQFTVEELNRMSDKDFLKVLEMHPEMIPGGLLARRSFKRFLRFPSWLK